MDPSDKDFKVTIFNVFKEIKDKIENFGRHLETIKKKQMKILELKMQ